MSPGEGAVIGFVLLLILLAGSMPVGFVMAAVGLIGFAVMVSPQAAFSMATIDFYTTLSDYNLTTIPLFVLMGQIAFHTGISRGLFNAAYHWMGRLPGGLAMSTVGACTAFGAIYGSGPATSATIASVALPGGNCSQSTPCVDFIFWGRIPSGGAMPRLSAAHNGWVAL